MVFVERKPTRLIFERHLKTPRTQQGENGIKQDPRFQELERVVLQGSLQKLPEIKRKVAGLGPGLRADYHDIEPDASLPLSPGQEERGRLIGERTVAKYGPVDMVEVSPYIRALTTLQYAQEGSCVLSQVPIIVRTSLRERSMGKEAEVLPFGRLYFWYHPEDLERFYKEGKNFTYPGGENGTTFGRRIRGVTRGYERSSYYDGKTVYQVSHSRVIQEEVKQLTRPGFFARALRKTNQGYLDIMVDTGSITVLEAKPRLLPFTRRRFRVISFDEKVA